MGQRSPPHRPAQRSSGARNRDNARGLWPRAQSAHGAATHACVPQERHSPLARRAPHGKPAQEASARARARAETKNYEQVSRITSQSTVLFTCVKDFIINPSKTIKFPTRGPPFQQTGRAVAGDPPGRSASRSSARRRPGTCAEPFTMQVRAKRGCFWPRSAHERPRSGTGRLRGGGVATPART